MLHTNVRLRAYVRLRPVARTVGAQIPVSPAELTSNATVTQTGVSAILPHMVRTGQGYTAIPVTVSTNRFQSPFRSPHVSKQRAETKVA